MNLLKSFVASLVIAGGISGASSAYAVPSSANLTFRVNNGGDFRANVTLNERPGRWCSVRLFSLLSNTSGNGNGVGRRTYLTVRRTRTTRVVFRAGDLPPVLPVTSGTGAESVAQINLQAQITCGATRFESVAAARYLDCGYSRSRAVSPNSFISSLKRKLNGSSASAASISSAVTSAATAKSCVVG